ncbi:hypothetical protein [Aquibium microcysteis]|uniref:hypothetical protein n=1 Tax=Aquibium microcysteis TaxID=675281 RepID=UPI00165D2C16|nr:hypothetical protein [Aquibium microcysteis]
MDDRRGRPHDLPAEGAGLRAAIAVAVFTLLAAALLLGFGGWEPELCSALRAGYPLCAL